MMLDCWKNSCHGATVVPTIAIINNTASEVIPPRTPGIAKSRAARPQSGCESSSIGICTAVTAMKTNIARSQRRKLPVAMIAINATAAVGTTMYRETPK